jgi:hypothetical protein
MHNKGDALVDAEQVKECIQKAPISRYVFAM